MRIAQRVVVAMKGAAQLREIALGERLQMLFDDRPCDADHLGWAAVRGVAMAQLQQQALAQVACTDTGRIETLQQLQRG